ncbi:hypothetical protein NAT47_05215 [Flavobacterium sp. HXWNR69]|uniref:Lipocalin-like domain-containing protein n=1 Tax=Flavobacterium fragile TaxID=2949085 RepID=A0ABT0TFP7_9FLAO|nr:hypothetical protein [Flavobacterium sp. HXWNR69]MCL9769810.1 hypothetical protein [Flavobacterium sp. HXWNR69]
MKLKHFLNLSLIGLLLMSCQSEENEVIQDTSQNLAKSSPLTNLISRVSQNPTSTDNVLDNSSCFSVVLPATVIVNGQNIVVSNQADYQTVQDAIDAFSNDDDIVNFVYPITVQFQNFTTLVVQNSDVLDDIMDDCGEDDGFDEIECINFNFPIVVNIYNANNQLAETISITNNVQLYNFLESLEDNEYIAIQYPISVTNSNNQTIVISNNDQFEDVIEDAIDDCDDDSPSSGSNGNLAAILSSGSWYVSYFYDDTDQTAAYSGYVFTFTANGTTQAILNGNILNGSWSNYIESGEEKLDLNYEGLALDELEDDWEVVEFTSTQIRLKDVSGGNEGTDYLYFTKN